MANMRVVFLFADTLILIRKIDRPLHTEPKSEEVVILFYNWMVITRWAFAPAPWRKSCNSRICCAFRNNAMFCIASMLKLLSMVLLQLVWQQHTGLPWIKPNANQYRWKSWHWSEIPHDVDYWQSMPIIANQCRIKASVKHWSELISNDRYWSALWSMLQFWSALIGIDGKWTMIEGVLNITQHSTTVRSLNIYT